MPTLDNVLNELIILDETGDSKVIWDQDKQEEVDAAKETFTRLKKKGYLAYKVNRNGDKGEVINRFDPTAEKMILTPQMQGG